MKRVSLFFLLFVFVLESLASNDVVYRYIDVESGLSNNYILDIESDNYGYIWVATNEGLNVISGNKVRKFYKSEGDVALPGNELNCLLNDAARNIMWVGTQRCGIVGFNYATGERIHYKKNDTEGKELSGNAITSLLLDSNNKLWASTYSNGINCIDIETGKITQYNKNNISGLKSDGIWTMDYDADADVLYMGHEQGGFSEFYISKLKAITYTKEDGLSDNTVRSVLASGNFVWICSDKGVSRFNRITKEFKNVGEGKYSGRCRDSYKTNYGILLAYEDYGTVLLDEMSGEFIEIGGSRFENASLSASLILRISKPNRIFEDSFKNIIIGTLDHGLIIVSHNTAYFTSNSGNMRGLDVGRGSGSGNVIGVATSTDGDVWVATDNMGVYNRGRRIRMGEKMSKFRISAMKRDSDGSLWICDRNGDLINYSPVSEKVSEYNIGVKDYDWLGIDIIGDSIWISSNSGINVFDKSKRECVAHHDVENNLIRKIARDEWGNIYI